MCLPPENYVELRVYERLVDRGVKPERALGVARKVKARYRERREARLSKYRKEA